MNFGGSWRSDFWIFPKIFSIDLLHRSWNGSYCYFFWIGEVANLSNTFNPKILTTLWYFWQIGKVSNLMCQGPDLLFTFGFENTYVNFLEMVSDRHSAFLIQGVPSRSFKFQTLWNDSKPLNKLYIFILDPTISNEWQITLKIEQTPPHLFK